MPTIVNTYAAQNAGLGDVLKDLGNSLWGPGASTAELARQKATGERRENSSFDVLQNLARGGAIDFSHPDARAAIAGLSDPRKFFQGHLGVTANTQGFDAPATSNAAIGAGESAASTPTGFNRNQANQRAIASEATRRQMETEQYKADTTPVNVIDPSSPTGYKTVSRSEVIKSGAPQVLSNADATGALKIQGFQNGYSGYNPQQQEAAGVAPAADKMMNWVEVDPVSKQVVRMGRTRGDGMDAATGQPLSPNAIFMSPGNAGGTNAFNSPMAPDNRQSNSLRTKIVGADELDQIAGRMEMLIKADPTLVGGPGNIQRWAQSAHAVANDVIRAMGKGENVDASLNNVRMEALQKYGPSVTAFIPELFKPQLNEIEAANAIMVYKAAATFFGQEGKELSDKDVNGARAVVGDVTSWGASSQDMLARLAYIRGMARTAKQNSSAMLQQQTVSPAGGPAPMQDPAAQPQQTQAPAQAAPAAAPQAAETKVINGVTYQKINGQWMGP